MTRALLTAVLATAVFSFLSSCTSDSGPAHKSRSAPPDKAWVTAISLHSNGAISRHSPIRVIFTHDVIPEAMVGKDASASISIEPRVEARATYASRRELVLRPVTEFAPATVYRIQLQSRGLEGLPEDTKPFQFQVTTLGVNFDVRVHGLEVEHERNELMQLSGRIETADTESRERVEKMLSVTLEGEPLRIVWSPSGRSFSFFIPDIRRTKQEQQLILRWDGAPLKVSNKGEQSWRVPALDEFAVTRAEAVEMNDQRQVQVRFSDALDARQELKGLIRLSRGEFTTSIQHDLLTLYVNKDLAGKVTLTLEEAIRSRSGQRLIGEREFEVEFSTTTPQVRFVGQGVILPDADKLTVPFEAVSARSVRVTALQVFEPNIPQFLQVNNLSGHRELGRVGRVLWRKTVPLASPVPGRWTRYDLDVTELMRQHPGGLFQLTLTLTPKDALYACPGGDDSNVSEVEEDPEINNLEDGSNHYSYWDDYEQEEYYGDINWNERGDPCKPAYYRYGPNLRAKRNLLASNIGLIAKRAQRGKLLVVATALDTTKPLGGVHVNAVNYQNQVLVSGTTDANGMVELEPKSQPFALIAEQGGRKGYLRVAPGVALPVSHFDVGGETLVAGIKGFLYGDRGVWRPGDPVYLTFALEDKANTLPPDHPVTLELRDPRGQIVQTITSNKPVGQFYAFELKTAADAPTGNWHAQALVGGASFGKTLKIETVMPNRLKVELDLGDAPVVESSPLKGVVSSQWLSGATAANLRANIEVRLHPAPTAFTRFQDYVFDDPARGFNGVPITVFDGELDGEGQSKFEKDLDLPRDVPGMLSATFISRVFERGGAFSINRETKTVAAFDRYVGLKLPKGDDARDMLLTDVKHTLEIATVNLDGTPTSLPRVEVSLYKVQWRWWWDQSGDSLAQYARSESTGLVHKETIATKDGRGQLPFEIKYPEWGRYLVRACDLDGGHCTGRVFYIDWPSWAGEARDPSGPAANVLMLSSDKVDYKVGETAVVRIPESAQGRALLTIESGSAILEARWLEAKPGQHRVQIPITGAMAPNVYAAVTLVQPHAGKSNDRPIRLYGVIPLKVTDPATRLAPAITSASEWKPQSKATFTVSETSGRAMDYTIAVVDEGLLGLTSFRTPNLHAEFFKREALGVATWDLFDEVAGAYGGQLDRLLALGGSDAGKPTNPDEGKSRFPPVVKFLGPFSLPAGERRPHSVDLPQYAGAVRVMVVAGNGSAYGSAEKSVYVRQELMILPTLPRVIGPAEQFSLPVSVFTSDASIRNVKLEVETDARFSPVGAPSAQVEFAKPAERMGFLTLRSGSQLGKGRIRVIATSGKFRAVSDVWLEVRTPNSSQSRFQRANLAPGESWKTTLPHFGLAGTQVASLEVSALPPINLEGRLDYLVHYPHGCLEQTTSAVFPQLYLPSLIRMDQNRRLEIANNVRAGLARLRSLQHPGGGFAYWPGIWNTDITVDWRNDWGTTYAGHFFLEAEKAGYNLPGDMKASWLKYQRSAAQQWSPRSGDVPPEYAYSGETWKQATRYAQAYRLYTLALAGQPEIGAMNRLRESSLTLAERWMLAAAYKLAGKPEVAGQLVDTGRVQAFVFADSNPYTFGSLLRDRAVVLMGMTLLGRDAESAPLLEDISAQLAGGEWYSTQSVAFALVAVAQNTGTQPFKGFGFEYVAGRTPALFSSESPVANLRLSPPPAAGLPLLVKNTADRKLYVTAAVRATPASGEEHVSSHGLVVEIVYSDGEKPLDPARIRQGMDLVAQITVRNTSKRSLDNLALTQMVPAGWEIRNDRLEDVPIEGERTTADSGDRRFWWVPAPWRGNHLRSAEYTDIRDDRLHRYFSLGANEQIFFETRLNAAYLGRFYLPGTTIEAMYDAKIHARQKGQWVEVVPAGR